MAKLKIEPYGEVFEIREGENLLKALRQVGYGVNAPCNGLGICGKCKVVAMGNLSDKVQEESDWVLEGSMERLSCKTNILGDVTVVLKAEKENLQTEELRIHTAQALKSSYTSVLKADGNYELSFCGDVFETTLKKKNLLGVAIDIGTTGIAYVVADLEKGEIRHKASALNRQVAYGGDVLSRMTVALEEKEGLKNLHETLIHQIHEDIEGMMAKIGESLESVYHLVVSANTTMVHFLFGVDVSSMARAPYRPKILAPTPIEPSVLGLFGFNDFARLSVMPSISAYVGGDIVSGMLDEEIAQEGLRILIDIGTNGEIVLMDGEKWYCASAAAGPALEGMNIECGLRAVEGAIEKFKRGKGNSIVHQTIGGKEAIGICGSGLIDGVGVLLQMGCITETGRWHKGATPYLRDKKWYFTEKVYLSQKDIRQIQLAKGAIAAGILTLLQQVGKTIDAVESIYIAGTFGYHISEEHLLRIGLVPKGFRGKIYFLGNTSLKGAYGGLIDVALLEKAFNISKNMSYVELSTSVGFQKLFIEQLNF